MTTREASASSTGRILKWSAAGAWLALTALWLLYVAQRPAPVWLAKAVAILAFAATVGVLVHGAVAMWRRGDRARLAAIGGLVLLALGLYLPGIRHEVGDNYYKDEGAYRKNATAINNGEFLRSSFNYPHLLYYADAFATWIASLFYTGVLALSDSLYGIGDWRVFCRLLARFLTALVGALTVVPAFFLGERLAGLGGGVASGLLIASAQVYHEGANLHTCDIPSAFFAMGCLAYVGRLLRQERLRDYLLAGVWAGLAAGSKYPAGLVAVAIFAVYVRGRIRERRGSWGLPVAAVAAVAAFIATTPAMVALGERSIFGDRGALFGWRQYSSGQWLGVVADDNLSFYIGQVVSSFGWLAVILGGVGLLLLERKARTDVAWLLPFPLVFLGLMASMNIVVQRNLYPALPPLAVLFGVGVWTLARRAASRLRSPRAARWAAPALAAIVLATPLARVTMQEIGYRRASTRQVAAEWIYQNLPHGSLIMKERYSPNLSRQTFKLHKVPFAGANSVDELRALGLDYVILAHAAYQRFLDTDQHFKPHHAIMERNYREIFERLALVQAFEPDLMRRGPVIRIYRVQASS